MHKCMHRSMGLFLIISHSKSFLIHTCTCTMSCIVLPGLAPGTAGVAPSREYSLAVVFITMAELLRLERDTSMRKTASLVRGRVPCPVGVVVAPVPPPPTPRGLATAPVLIMMSNQ